MKLNQRGTGHLGLIILVILVVAAVGGIGAYVARKNIGHAASCPSYTYGQGYSNPYKEQCVKGIQKMLNFQGKASPVLVVDGEFGAKSKTAVQNFQSSNGLRADGIVGPKTWAKLCGTYGANHTQEEEYDALRRAVECPGVPPATPAPSSSTEPSNPAVYQVYLSPSGNDGNGGGQGKPVKTLARAQAIIKAAKPTKDVQVIISQGTYSSNSVTWDTYISGHTITFRPPNYTPDTACPERPKFTGDSNTKYWFEAQGRNVNTNLKFYCLQVEKYPVAGIYIDGGKWTQTDKSTGRKYARPVGIGANGNTIYGMLFQNIGTKYVTYSGKFGEGGVELQNSSNNILANNTYQNLINNTNSKGDQQKIHGVYLKLSSNNEIRGSTFAYISGDPVQVRDDANDNYIHDNTFTKTGHDAYLTEYVGTEAANGAFDCASAGNRLYYNTFGGTYTGQKIVDYFTVYPAADKGIGFTGGGPCSNSGFSYRAKFARYTTNGSDYKSW